MKQLIYRLKAWLFPWKMTFFREPWWFAHCKDSSELVPRKASRIGVLLWCKTSLILILLRIDFSWIHNKNLAQLKAFKNCVIKWWGFRELYSCIDGGKCVCKVWVNSHKWHKQPIHILNRPSTNGNAKNYKQWVAMIICSFFLA